MEQQTTNSTEALTEEQLRDAGASVAYISYYLTAIERGVHTNSTDHAETVVNSNVSYSGGGFHESLWDDSPRWGGDNPFGADDRNSRLLAEAGIAPYAESETFFDTETVKSI
jgi:hypothetical protein